MRTTIISSILILNMGCSVSTNNTSTQTDISIKPTSSPIIQNTNSPIIQPTNEKIEKIDLPIIELKLNRETKDKIFNLKTYINSKGDGLLVYNNYFRKITNFKISDKEDIYYKPENKDIISIVELNVNESGNGFLITDKVTTCTTKDNSCLYDYSSRKIFKIIDFNIDKEINKNQFDSISIDNNGNGIGYIYNQLKNTIEYKLINKFNIDGLSKLLSSEKNKIKVKLDNNGNGFIFYFENINNNDKKDSILYVKKISNLVPEKDFTKVKVFQINDFINIDEVNLNLDSIGNGYIYFIKDKLYINEIIDYIFSNKETIFEINSSINLQLNSNGTSSNSYVENNNGTYNINYQIFDKNSFKENNIVSASKEYLNNNSICLNSNGDGFIYWLKNDQDIHLRYISKYNLLK